MLKRASLLAALIAASFSLFGATGRAQACPASGLSGTYILTLTGWVSRHKLSASGYVNASGGSFSRGFLTFSLSGTIRTASLSGSYTANACSGSATLDLSSGGSVHFNFDVNGSGNAFVGTETDGGTVVTVKGEL